MSTASERMLELSLKSIKDRDFVRAKKLLVETIKLEPNETESWILRGNVLCLFQEYFDAALHYDRAIDINPSLWDAWNNRGSAFANIGMWDEAERSFNESIRLNANKADPHIGLANMYHSILRLDDCEREFREALRIDPTAGIHFNLALVLLGKGQWDEALKEYEYRWLDNPAPPRAILHATPWRGESLKGKSILLCPEQGYGDEIMALRFANRELLGAGKVIVQARAPIIALAKTLDHVDSVIPLNDPLPEVDFSCALLDIPRRLGMGPFTIPRPHAYLRPPYEHRIEYWRNKIAALPSGMNVGLCWASGNSFGLTTEGQTLKSIPVHMLTELVMPGVNFISLQKPLFEEVPLELGLHDWMGEVEDFADTAALIECLDLVITVDTAVAHTAGAIGKQVWNFVRYAGFFPWLAPWVAKTPDYSIWYPSMTLFRQPELGEWTRPLRAAKSRLREMKNEDGIV